MRLLDADILAYALYDESPAHNDAWSYIEKHIKEDHQLHITATTILETYNTLYWYYHVRPIQSLLEKITLILETLKVVETSINGLQIASTENIPLGDGFLIATAQQNRLPIIVSNDQHIAKKAEKYDIINENPITPETRKKLSQQ
jgi:predicted nucleic acid-binding protein